jgi:hypothetical protein
MSILKRSTKKLATPARPTRAELDAERPGVLAGLKDLEEGRYTDYDAEGLMQFGRDVVAGPKRRLSRRQSR